MTPVRTICKLFWILAAVNFCRASTTTGWHPNVNSFSRACTGTSAACWICWKHEQRWDELVVWAERWIAQDGNPEAAYRALMLAYSALNDHAKLRAAFGRCERSPASPGTGTVGRAARAREERPTQQQSPHTSFQLHRTHAMRGRKWQGCSRRSRLVTLTGSGGVGKTRLAIEIGRNELPRFMDGVWFVSLAALQDSEAGRGDRPEHLTLAWRRARRHSSADRLRENLASRSMLLILDNCEHVAAACVALVELLLDGCPDLRLLVTGREPLAAQDETTYRVPSLELPPAAPDLSPASLAACASVQLFAERARARVASFGLTNQQRRLRGVHLQEPGRHSSGH